MLIHANDQIPQKLITGQQFLSSSLYHSIFVFSGLKLNRMSVSPGDTFHIIGNRSLQDFRDAFSEVTIEHISNVLQ